MPTLANPSPITVEVIPCHTVVVERIGVVTEFTGSSEIAIEASCF